MEEASFERALIVGAGSGPSGSLARLFAPASAPHKSPNGVSSATAPLGRR